MLHGQNITHKIIIIISPHIQYPNNKTQTHEKIMQSKAQNFENR
jgi:DNA gyrase/topoisomerase IV subunit B